MTAAAVRHLMVEPGSYASETGRLRNAAGFASAKSFGLNPGVDAMA